MKRKIFFNTIILVSFLYLASFILVANASEDKPVSLTDINADYSTSSKEKANILIVPGHEPNYGGAQFGSLYERNMVVEVGQDLQKFLETNPSYKVSITRNTKSWSSTFADYFKNHWNDIIAWEKTSKKNESKLVALGPSTAPSVIHNSAPTDVAIRLYGITKWANENNIDLMIHLHFNDYPGHSSHVAGKYSGLVIYTPAIQYANSPTTKAIADAVFKRLSLYNPISNLPIESKGVIDDPELIAVGANNTADAASMLIEYDYIYEPQFVNPKVHSLALKDLAYQTYLGIQDFFNKNTDINVTSLYNPESLYAWKTQVTSTKANPEDIYALQTALIMDGDLPPAGKSKNDCPHSGIFGSCTRLAIQAFQQKNNITGESVFGSKTFSMLNSIYMENQK